MEILISSTGYGWVLLTSMHDGSDITAVIKFAPEYIRVRESLEERRRERTRCKIVLKFDLGKYYIVHAWRDAWSWAKFWQK